MREMRETADLMKDQIDPKKIAEDAERAVEASVPTDRGDAELASTGDPAEGVCSGGSDDSPAVEHAVDSERNGVGDFDDPFDDPIDAVDPVDEPDGTVDEDTSLDPGVPSAEAGDLTAPSVVVDDNVDDVADGAMEESA
ncbi:hypothetical protein N9Q18_01585 [bacterium]|nr:hypothetical protein [bacterium]